MKDVSSLQIDPRCIKCDRHSSKDIVLYEMRNHRFICSDCRQEAEEHGKQIAWVDVVTPPTTTMTTKPGPRKTRTLTPSLPPDSLFASLNLSLDTPVEEIESTIEQKMKYWLRAPKSQEQRKMVEQLHEWQEKVEDQDAFETYRATLRPQRRSNALSVGGRPVFSAEEFVAACEASQDGWADGERYLRKGQLKQWALYLLQDKILANDLGQYQAQLEISDFRALNQALYRLQTERPFRLYQEEKWQTLDQIISASTAQELTEICDLYWASGEKHLYEGSMVFWLEYCQDISGLTTYYKNAVVMYRSDKMNRGLGLELLLEHAVPSLPKPRLRVTFDGIENAYTLDRWDRELPHQPVAVAITNTTRGFTSVRLKTNADQKVQEINWLSLSPHDPLIISGRPGSTTSATARIYLQDLASLRRGKRYQKTITMDILGEQRKIVASQTFPITLRTMSFFQGLRGKLWQWGLRGNVPGLFWNGIIAALLSFLLLTILPRFVPTTWHPSLASSGNQIIPLLQTSLLMAKSLLVYLHSTFILVAVLIIAIAGFMVGRGKGHMDYTLRQGASDFRKWTTWLSLVLTIALSFWTRDAQTIGTLFSQQNNSFSSIDAAFHIASYFLIWLILLFIAQIIAIIRIYLEKFLRSYFAILLNLPGRR